MIILAHPQPQSQSQPEPQSQPHHRHGICHKWRFWTRVKFSRINAKIVFPVKFAKFRRDFSQINWSDIVLE